MITWFRNQARGICLLLLVVNWPLFGYTRSSIKIRAVTDMGMVKTPLSQANTVRSPQYPDYIKQDELIYGTPKQQKVVEELFTNSPFPADIEQELWAAFAEPKGNAVMSLPQSQATIPPQDFQPKGGDPPDFDGFRPAGSENHVDPLSGDFQYSLPALSLPCGSYDPYTLQLSYSSATGIEDDASWVGYGWSMTPGAIQRNVRGIPDSYNGNSITYLNKAIPDWRAEGTARLGAKESYSVDEDDAGRNKDVPDNDTTGQKAANDKAALEQLSKGISLDVNSNLRYGNYQGFYRTYGLNLGSGFGGVDVSFGPMGTTYSFNPPTVQSLLDATNSKKEYSKLKKGLLFSNIDRRLSKLVREMDGTATSYSLGNPLPTTRSPRFRSNSFGVGFDLLVLLPYVHIGVAAGLAGTFSISTTASQGDGEAAYRSTYGAYGYDHIQSTPQEGKLNDYGTEKGGSFTQRELYLGIPFANYDQFSVSGEGIAGSFRRIYTKGALVQPDLSNCSNFSFNLGVALNVAPITGVGVGANFGFGISNTQYGGWASLADPALTFDPESSYYRFNGDMGGSVVRGNQAAGVIKSVLEGGSPISIPGTKVITPALEGQRSITPQNMASEGKGAKVIAKTDQGFVITREDGFKYFYEKELKTRGEVNLQLGHPSLDNLRDQLVFKPCNLKRAANNTYSFEDANLDTYSGEIRNDAYAYSYLLTKITGPDYEKDAKGKEFGYYINFKYRNRFAFGGDTDSYYRTRKPYAGLSYNHGKISNRRDQSASFQSSEREISYLAEIETPSHIAYFISNKTSYDNAFAPECDSCFKFEEYWDLRMRPQGLCANNPYPPYTGLDYILTQAPDSIRLFWRVNTCSRDTLNMLMSHTIYYNSYVLQPLGYCPIEFEAKSKTFSLEGIRCKRDYREFFLKGSQVDRLDALSALKAGALDDPASLSSSALLNEASQLEYLERVVVFSKFDNFHDSLLRPLSTTNFEYDYSLAPNQPSSASIAGSTSQRLGKLTLRRVYSDGDDKVSAKVTPYVFNYEHRRLDDYPLAVANRFGRILPVSRADIDQNPLYSPMALDAWQDLAPYAVDRKSALMDARWQGNSPPRQSRQVPTWSQNSQQGLTTPDPGAYKLKRIQLPGGGEMLVNYEQRDYAYVQDKPACVLVTLLDAAETSGNEYSRHPTYVLNAADLGIEAYKPIPQSTTGPARNLAERRNIAFLEQWQLIKKMYEPGPGKTPERIYFKFLYKLNSEQNYQQYGPVSVRDCQSEFIDGYARVSRVDTFSWPATNNRQEVRIRIELDGTGGSRPLVPRTACLDFYATHKHGMFTGDLCVGAAEDFTVKIFDNGPSFPVRMDQYLADLASGDISRSMPARFAAAIPTAAWMVKYAASASTYSFPSKLRIGEDMDKSLSGFRIPMLASKQGGGVRVKSVLFYESGLEGGEAALFGREYLYKTFEQASNGKYRVISSGVASNEPSINREENPLITYLPKADQSFLNRLAVGEDREQLEGPVGETFLPGGSVTYSKVFARDIGGERHGLGYSINEYYTYKDYPTNGLLVNLNPASKSLVPQRGLPTVYMSNLAAGTEKDPFTLGGGGGFKAGIVSISFQLGLDLSKLWTSQSFRFVSTDFAGKPIRTATFGDTLADLQDFAYSGAYLEATELEPSTPVSEQITEYYAPGDSIKTFSGLDSPLKTEIPGLESDLLVERRSSKELRVDPRLSFDLNVWAPAFNPSFSCALGFSIGDKSIYSQATVHTIRIPAIIKRQTVRDDQVTKQSENLVFDHNTGQAILTSSLDSYNKNVYNLSMPAYYIQAGMASQGAGATIHQQLTDAGANITLYDENPFVPQSPGEQLVLKTELTKIISAQFQTYRNTPLPVGESAPAALSFAQDAAGFAPVAGISTLPCFKPSETLSLQTSVQPFNIDGIETAGLMQRTIKQSLLSDTLANRKYVSSGIVNSHFLRSSLASFYGPGAKSLESKDALGYVKSSSHSTSAQLENSTTVLGKYGSSAFYDFEPSNAISGNCSIAHTGRMGVRIPSNSNYKSDQLAFLVYPIGSTTQYEVFFWATAENGSFDANSIYVDIRKKGYSSIYISEVAKKVASSEDWTLFRCEFDIAQYANASIQNFNIGFSNQNISLSLIIDDIRIQPIGTQMSATVLDQRRLKVLASFDDNHFGTLYQYDADGKLIRKLKETVEGRVTLSESVSNEPKRPRIFKP